MPLPSPYSDSIRTSLDDGHDSPGRPHDLMFSLGGDLEVCIKSVHTRFPVIRLSAYQFRQAILLKGFVHSIERQTYVHSDIRSISISPFGCV